MRRSSALFIVFALIVVGITPSVTAAQSGDDPLGWGEGVAADAATAEGVQTFFEDFTAAVNLGDGSAANVLSLELLTAFYGSYEEGVAYFSGAHPSFNVYPTELFGVDTILVYPSGGVSAEVQFQGIATLGGYFTYKYSLIETDYGYAIHYLEVLEPRLADGMTSAPVNVTISDDGLSLSEAEVAGVDVIVLNIENVSMENVLSTGLYVLPDGVTASDAQAQLAVDISAFEWLGGTPTGPDSESTYAFVVDPGSTYLVQQYADGGDNQFRVLLEGEQYVAIITVAPGEPVQ